jgi:FKBP-type peptidyl-prolyl cis-trans isomerase
MFDAVDEVLREAELTPADVAECLVTAKRAGPDEPSTCLEVLISELKKRAEEKAKAEAEAKAKAEEEAKAKAEAEAKAEEEAKAKTTAKAEAETKVNVSGRPVTS